MQNRPAEGANVQAQEGEEEATGSTKAIAGGIPPKPAARKESEEGWKVVSGQAGSSKDPHTLME
eukprot:6508209-Heterocapsa_arctica.AAC.1